MGSTQTYESLVADALATSFSGWDFTYLKGRVRDCEIPWSYDDLAGAAVVRATHVLDLDTGGGETLAGILKLRGLFATDSTSPRIVAVEAWPPNVPIARKRLEPLGIVVRESAPGQPLPAENAEFDLVLNRHGGIDPAELHRVLAPGGTFLTQQVGNQNDIELNLALGGPPPRYADYGTLEKTADLLARHGFEIVRAEEAFAEFGFLDIGAVVFHLRAVSWQVPGFDVATYDAQLRELDARIRAEGVFVVRHYRYLIEAIRN